MTPQIQFLIIFGDEIYPRKKVCDEFLFWQQPTIFLRIKLCVDVARKVTVKNIKFETHSYGLHSYGLTLLLDML